MEIVVNDTNIFIDLHSIRLLDQFFELPITVHTVDFVINELTDEVQFKAINKYIENGKLKVQSFEADELLEIIELQSKAGGNVSIPDCAVWNYAKKHNYTLLTGDGQLRKKAIESNVTVKGIIYIFDHLVECKIITPQYAVIKLQELMKHNSRLPKSIIQERIEKRVYQKKAFGTSSCFLCLRECDICQAIKIFVFFQNIRFSGCKI